MLKEELKTTLTEIIKKQNVDGLISFMENSVVEYHMADLRGPLAMATFEGVFIDLKQIMSRVFMNDTRLIYFVILHETAHIKRMKKLGKEEIIKKLSLNIFDEFFEDIVGEELIADRYGCYIYKKLNNEEFPLHMTQQLNLDINKNKYKETVKGVFGRVQNDEKKYKELFEQFIIKKYD
jgi:hypothetical protein